MRYADCSAALEALAEGLDTGACHDYRETRQVVMCDAWASKPTSTQDFRQRVREGWQKVHSACAGHGGTTPETGFLEPAPPTEPVQILAIKYAGQTEGLLVLQPDGEVTACVESIKGESPCKTASGGQSALEGMKALLEAQGFEVVAE